MNGINVALLAAALLVLVLFSRRTSAAAVAAPSPAKPVDNGVKPGQVFAFPPDTLLKLAGSTISGTKDAPVNIDYSSIGAHSEFHGWISPDAQVQLTAGAAPVSTACLAGGAYRMGIGSGSVAGSQWCNT